MNIKNLNKPQSVKFSYLSFDTGLSSELAITTTFSRKNGNWIDQITTTICMYRHTCPMTCNFYSSWYDVLELIIVLKETLLSYFCKSKCQMCYLGSLYMKLSLLILTFLELFLEVRFLFCEKFPLIQNRKWKFKSRKTRK